LYSVILNEDKAAEGAIIEEEKSFQDKFITLTALDRPAVAQWLQRELQALLLQEDVNLLSQHILGNLKHGIEASFLENKRLKGPGIGRLEGEKAVEIIAAAMAAYLPEHSKRLGQELVGFVLSGLNIDAHDAVVFRIPEEDVGKEQSIEGNLSPPI
jgi:hypothetical protein